MSEFIMYLTVGFLFGIGCAMRSYHDDSSSIPMCLWIVMCATLVWPLVMGFAIEKELYYK